MFATNTVLILGAGASIPYGFPSGAQLVTQICAKGPQGFTAFGIPEAQGADFIQSLRGSEQPSVDAFLEHRPKFLDIGKIAIAATLIEFEQEEKLRNRGDWYGKLIDRLTILPLSKFHENRLTIITFNYDRSLEHFLFSTIQHRYGISAAEAGQLLNDFPIIHVHGRLGYLPWQSSKPDEMRPYTPTVSIAQGAMNQVYQAVEIAAKGIKIISERDALEENQDFMKAREALSTAGRIYFLGFGYHPDNIRRLGVPWGKLPIEGSCYGMTKAESEYLRILYSGFMPYQGTCIEFLRNSDTFIKP